ncbi:cytochrome b/b6 domain-containing protein [Psychrosphaera sp. B3R10]|uniref:cytochrome b/b6 domain-containing protein n=1 Tax=unclassified Psychrosphaera TaxID=2641570 RepID=UPI001C0827FC|nr:MULTISPECIES: cytochrome b/b6 domain-containing protein [unclassified Psychrosphaera]MBU2881747.1 cytochrome b/b6 domain-containing protein [Psychrosphaera sp. I2R16]MBU2990168.1 cytochrome b/b6 domain-containing protein [Psychrosphaera sp. B3R10]
MAPGVLIWDLPTRLFHWLLVLSFSASFIFAKLGSEFIDWHLRSGYVVLALLTFRLMWGIVGTRYALFKSLNLNPQDIWRYGRSLVNPKVNDNLTKTYAGHNPLGSLMVVFLLSAIAMQAVSGLFMDDEIFTTGPYSGALGDSVDAVMSTIHHNLINVILVAIGFHVFAAFYYLFRKKQNLIKAMFTGRKLEEGIVQEHQIQHSKLIIALVVVIVAVLFVYWLVVLNAPVIEEWY